MDLSAVLLTDSTLMPDTKMSVVNKDKVEDDKETVNEILEDLKKDLKRASGADGEKVEKSFVNSFITEIDVADPPQDFKLNLFIKPIIDIVSQRENVFLKSKFFTDMDMKINLGCASLYDSKAFMLRSFNGFCKTVSLSRLKLISSSLQETKYLYETAGQHK